MFDAIKSFPYTYNNESRDFQILSRVVEIVENDIMTSSDMVHNVVPNINSDPRLQDLTASTLGFDVKHKYNEKDLTSILSCFFEIIKNKGTLNAIELVIKILLRAQNINSEYRIVITNESSDEDKEYVVELYLPKEITDTILIKDLFSYVLPAGYRYKIYKTDSTSKKLSTKTSVKDKQANKKVVEVTGGIYTGKSSIHSNIGKNAISQPANSTNVPAKGSISEEGWTD